MFSDNDNTYLYDNTRDNISYDNTHDYDNIHDNIPYNNTLLYDAYKNFLYDNTHKSLPQYHPLIIITPTMKIYLMTSVYPMTPLKIYLIHVKIFLTMSS